jgi:hypothetical protein
VAEPNKRRDRLAFCDRHVYKASTSTFRLYTSPYSPTLSSPSREDIEYGPGVEIVSTRRFAFADRGRGWDPTRSVTRRCRSNSSLANLRVSVLVVGSSMRLVPRSIVRYSDRAFDRWRNWHSSQLVLGALASFEDRDNPHMIQAQGLPKAGPRRAIRVGSEGLPRQTHLQGH